MDISLNVIFSTTEPRINQNKTVIVSIYWEQMKNISFALISSPFTQDKNKYKMYMYDTWRPSTIGYPRDSSLLAINY